MTPFEALKADFKTLSGHVLDLAKAANGTADNIEALDKKLIDTLESKFEAFETKLDDLFGAKLDEKFKTFMSEFETRFFGSMDASSSTVVAEVGDVVGKLSGTETIIGGQGSDTVVSGQGDLLAHDAAGNETTATEEAETPAETGLDPTTGLPASN